MVCLAPWSLGTLVPWYPGNRRESCLEREITRVKSRAIEHTIPALVAPFYVAAFGADIVVGLGAVTYHRGRSRVRGRRVPRWAVVAVAAVAAVTLVVVFGSTLLQVYRLEREAARLEQLKRDLEVQNAQLREEIRLLHTPQYIEKLAREQLGLVKPGEIALLIVPAPTDSSRQRPLSGDRDKRLAPDGAGQRPAPYDAGRHPSEARAGWASRVWDAFRSLFH